MNVNAIIQNNPLNPTIAGYVKRKSDGKIFKYLQNSIEANLGIAMLIDTKAETISISDLNCVLWGLSFESKFVIPLPGLYDITLGFEIIQSK